MFRQFLDIFRCSIYKVLALELSYFLIRSLPYRDGSISTWFVIEELYKNLWDITLCSPLEDNGRSGGIWRLHPQSWAVSQTRYQNEGGSKQKLWGPQTTLPRQLVIFTRTIMYYICENYNILGCTYHRVVWQKLYLSINPSVSTDVVFNVYLGRGHSFVGWN
jgi:hypothetical protein